VDASRARSDPATRRSVGIAAEMQPAASSLMGMAVYTGAAGFALGTLLHFFVSVVPLENLTQVHHCRFAG